MLRQGTTNYTTQNQVQIFSVIKWIETSEVTLTILLDHLFIIAWI